MTTHSAAQQNALLLVVCLAQFMVILDVAIVNVALPSIRCGLHFSTTGLQWVVNAYTLTFAGFLMLGGRSADLLGRRRVFLAGTALFALVLAGLRAGRPEGLLIGARALQGLGGAVLSPATLSIITSTLARGPRAQPRPRHVGRGGRPRRVLRRAARRRADPGLRLAGDLRRQRAARRDRGRARPARDPARSRAVEGTRHFDVAGRRPGHRRPRQPDVRDRPHRHARLGRRPACSCRWSAAGAARARSCSSRRASRRSRWCRSRSSGSASCAPPNRRRAAVRVVLPGLVLPDPVPAAGAPLRRDRGRARVPADDAVDLRRVDAGAARGRAVRARAR